MKIKKAIVGTGILAGAGCVTISKLRRVRSRRLFIGKVVLITGGSRGFGLALATEFGRQGAQLILTARDREGLESAKKKLLSAGLGLRDEDVQVFSCDLSSADETKKMVAGAVDKFGRVDVLVNNAGIITVGPVENQSVNAFHSTMENNFYTMLHATLAVLPQMLERHDGEIVNITSIGAKLAVPHLLPYSASKFAALGFSQGLHAELRSKGIHVTTVCPGLMRTGSHTHALFTGDRVREYRWFSLGATLPGISTSAKRAARQVVRAVAKHRAEITITPQALLVATFAQALPACTAMWMHWVNTFALPKPVHSSEITMLPGKQVGAKLR